MKSILFFLCFLHIIPCYGQVVTTRLDYSDVFNFNGSLSKMALDSPLKTMPYVDVEKLLAEDAELEGLDVPFNFGYLIDVNYSLEDGIWEQTSTERKWSIRVLSKGAYTLNFTISKLILAPGAELYIYNKEGTMVFGPLTSENTIPNDFLITDVLSGDESIIHLIEPLNAEYNSDIRISKVVHGYVDLFKLVQTRGIGDSDACHYDITRDRFYEKYSKAVGCIIFQVDGRQSHCSGALINNTSSNRKGYFLTAFHCLDVQSPRGVLSEGEKTAVNNWMVRFNFLSNTTQYISVSGANFLSAWVETDFALVELPGIDNVPAETFSFGWLGWDRTSINYHWQGFGIHHPRGDYQKISFAYSPITPYPYGIQWSSGVISSSNTHWAPFFNTGGTEGGSSGSPLLNSECRVIGQLHGGNGVCKVNKYYGRFDLSWEGGGTPTTRLKDWLDPLGTNMLVIDLTYKELNPSTSSNFFLNGTLEQQNPYNLSSPLYTDRSNYLYGTNIPTYVTLYTDEELKCIENETQIHYEFNKIENGVYKLYFLSQTKPISFTVTNGITNMNLTFLPLPTYSHYYSSGSRNIVVDFDENELEPYIITIINISGSVVKTINTREKHTEINVSNLNNGLHYMTIYGSNNQVIGSEKIMITNK